jgi:hypothetical protein
MSEKKASTNQLISLTAGGFAGAVEAAATVRLTKAQSLLQF